MYPYGLFENRYIVEIQPSGDEDIDHKMAAYFTVGDSIPGILHECMLFFSSKKHNTLPVEDEVDHV